VYTNVADYPSTKNRRSMSETNKTWPYTYQKLKNLPTWRGPIELSIIKE
jgi:hypothetical protein